MSSTPTTGLTTRTLSSRSVDETRDLGARLGRSVRPLPAGGLVVALLGELGAGKTAFVQGVARGLGVSPEESVVSPTFTVARDYLAQGATEVRLVHVDAYRLRGSEDLEAAGFEEMCGEGLLTCVEWADRVEASLPVDRIQVLLRAPRQPGSGEDRREVVVQAGGPLAAGVLARWLETS